MLLCLSSQNKKSELKIILPRVKKKSFFICTGFILCFQILIVNSVFW